MKGIVKAVADGDAFREGTWGAEIIDELKPQEGDVIYFKQIYIISLLLSQRRIIVGHSIKPRLQLAGWFLSEGTIHLSEWHPPVCDVENSRKGECHS